MHTHFAHFINRQTAEERYTALECPFVRGAAAVKFAERMNERSGKTLRFTKGMSARGLTFRSINSTATGLNSAPFYILFSSEFLM